MRWRNIEKRGGDEGHIFKCHYFRPIDLRNWKREEVKKNKGEGSILGTNLRCFEKALLFEMGIEGKRIPDSQGAHDFETDAIDKA